MKHVTMYGAEWCPDCRRAKRFLHDNSIEYAFVDVDQDDRAADYVTQRNNGKRIIPSFEINDSFYANPNNETLSKLLNVNIENVDQVFDLIIIGGGAAGLTASIYAQRDRFESLILEGKNVGGNAYITKNIENYPGFQHVSGPELVDRMQHQAESLGARIETGVEVHSIEKTLEGFSIKSNSRNFHSRSVLIATGSTYRRLNIPGEEELIGSGVHFCATCDGAFYRNKDIVVIGSGNSAVEESIFLSGFCNSVTIIARGESLSATKTYTDKLDSIDNISVITDVNVKKFLTNSNGQFKGVVIQSKDYDHELREVEADGAFIFIGLVPNTQPFKKLIEVSSSGHILTTGLNHTSVDGIFAAGDCRHGAIAQVASATGEGVVASYGIREYLKRELQF